MTDQDETPATEGPGGEQGEEQNRPMLDLGSYIRHQRESAKLSVRKLSKLAGVSNPYLSQIERGLRKPSAEILQAIAKALQISSETLYVKAGILEEREGDGDLEDAIYREEHLTDEQRQTLIRMYRTFRELNGLHAAPAQAEKEPGTLEKIVGSLIPGGDDASDAETDAPVEDLAELAANDPADLTRDAVDEAAPKAEAS